MQCTSGANFPFTKMKQNRYVGSLETEFLLPEKLARSLEKCTFLSRYNCKINPAVLNKANNHSVTMDFIGPTPVQLV